MEGEKVGYDSSIKKAFLVIIAGLVLSLGFVAGLTVLPKPAEAATCGGTIVLRTATNYKGSGSNAIYVSTGGRRPAITRIEFLNDSTSSYEVVPNADYGVAYSTPIGQEGQYFVYGVAKRWVAWPPEHWKWQQIWRWRVFYNC